MDRSTTDSCAGALKSDCKAVDRSHAALRLTIMVAIVWCWTFKKLQKNIEKRMTESSSGSSSSDLINSEIFTTQYRDNQSLENSMQMIGPDNFADEVLSADQPVLLLYMPCDDDFPSQSRLIEDITQRHKSWLKTGLLAEAFNEYFKNKLDVHGTPTFLIFLDGKEKNRMFGLADPESLDLFIRETLNHGAADH